MAGPDFGDHTAYAPSRAGQGAVSRSQKLINIIGAIGSVALVISLGYWGWELAVRDVRGVPVIKALEGPMRMAPATPGGQVVDYQGLSVNNVAAKDGTAGSDKLVLAPAPVGLTLEDVPGLSNSLPPLEAGSAPDAPVTPTAPTPPPPVPLIVTQEDAVNAALAEALGLDEGTAEELVETAALDEDGNPPPAGAITRSPRPQLRPSVDPEAAAAALAPAAATSSAAPEVDPATLTPGTRLVQFGAFDTADLARAEWSRVSGRLGALMNGKSMVIQAAESGGQMFYRLRGLGFDSEDDARRFCSAAKADGVNCVPVAHR